MVNTGLPEDLESMGGSSSIHDALQLRWVVTGVEDPGIPRICGNEHASMEAAKREWLVFVRWELRGKMCVSCGDGGLIGW